MHKILGVDHAPDSVILTDGYAAYASYAKKVGIAHALCWSHSRREFVDAQSTEPQGSLEALRIIGALYAVEDDIRRLGLTGEAKKLHRLTHSKLHVEAFFAWVDRRIEEHGLRPTTLFTKALNYVRERRLGLELFLTDPMCHWIPTIWSVRCAPSRWAGKIGISVGPSWARNTSGSCGA